MEARFTAGPAISITRAAPEELPEAVALLYTVPNTDDGHGYEDEHAQDYQHPSKEPCTLEVLLPGLDGIHNVLRRRSEQLLVLHQSDCCIEHQQDGEDEAERQYEGKSHSLYAFCALPNLSIAVADKAEVAAVAALTECFGADEIDVVQIAVVDDVAVAEHGAEAFQYTVFGKQVLIQALYCLKVIILLGIFRMPYILPTLSR